MRYIVYIGFIFSSLISLAQSGPALEAVVSKSTVQEGEIFTYQIISNEDCQITPPDFGELEVVGGPEKGFSSNTQIINNVTKKMNQYSLTFYLRSNKKGTYTIPPATMKCKMKKVNSGESISIKVTAGSGGTGTNPTPNATYFFKLYADKTTVFIGEPFVLTLKYFSTKRPDQVEVIEDGTAFGLWRKDLNANRTSYTMTQETIKGVRYYVLELKQELCIADRTGKIAVEPYYASLIHTQDFFNSSREDGKSNGLTIDVKKLPVELPANFNGLVGKFDLVHEIDKTTLKQGQSLTLNVRITGTGNFNAFDPPKLILPAGFTANDPSISDETEVTASGLRGSIGYEFIISANEPGDYEIQPYSFSYFDLGTKSIKQLSTEKFTIHVEKGDENHGQIYTGKEPIDVQNTDIHYIHESKGNDVNLSHFVFGTLPYYALLILPPVLVLLVMFTRRRKKNMTEEEKSNNTLKAARKNAQKSLAASLQQLKSGDEKAALKSLQHTLITYLMTKLNLPLSGLSLRSITTELELRKTSTELLLNLTDIWKKIEMAQYAPITAANLEGTIRDTQKLIDQLDANLS